MKWLYILDLTYILSLKRRKGSRWDEIDYDAVIEDRLDRLLARLEDDWNFVKNLQNVSIVIKSCKTQWLSTLSIHFTCLFCRFVILVS